MIRLIKEKEELNLVDYTVTSNHSSFTKTYIFTPFKECYPFDRKESLDFWEKMALNIYISRKYVKYTEDGLEYDIYYGQQEDIKGRFEMRCSVSEDKTSYSAEKITAFVEKALRENVVPAINEIIEWKLTYDFGIKCFPEMKQTDAKIKEVQQSILDWKREIIEKCVPSIVIEDITKGMLDRIKDIENRARYMEDRLISLQIDVATLQKKMSVTTKKRPVKKR